MTTEIIKEKIIETEYFKHEDWDYTHSFYHFSQRLLLRYGIVISYSEYQKYCNEKITLLYKISKYKRFGILRIKGKDVWVIKSNLNKNLVTCLSRGGELPVPKYYVKKLGITNDIFENDVRNAIITCQIVKKYVKEENMSYKQIFIERPFNLPEWVYSVVYNLLNPRKNKKVVNNPVNILVMNLYGKNCT